MQTFLCEEEAAKRDPVTSQQPYGRKFPSSCRVVMKWRGYGLAAIQKLCCCSRVLAPESTLPIRRIIALLILGFLCGSVAFASKPDKAQIEADVRLALAHAGFHHRPMVVEADIRPVGVMPALAGKYRLVWNSSVEWSERFDFGAYSDVSFGKGQSRFHKSNSAAVDFWIILGREAFDPHLAWHDGSEWTLNKTPTDKVDGVPAQCASFKAGRFDDLEACIDAQTKDLLLLQHRVSFYYSRYETVPGGRYPRQIEARSAYSGVSFLVAEITAISQVDKSSGPDPAMGDGAEEHPNCASTELRGGMFSEREVPQYPQSARLNRIAGTVALILDIRSDGTVNVRNSVSRVDKALNDAAIQAVKRWKYSPLLCRGAALSRSKVVTVDFSLRPY